MMRALLFSIDWGILLQRLQSLHPVIGFLGAALESFFPFLPLTAMVAFNVYTYGFWAGWILSFAGTVCGSTLLFFTLRRLFGASLHNKAQKNARFRRILEKIQRRGFTPLFLLYCFPFTPSFFVSASAALAEVDSMKFLAALVSGKLVMIYILSSIGFHLQDILDRPIRSVVVLFLIFTIWVVLEKVVRIDERI